MSFTTRCPACGTTFRIVADQLKISEGWVRCGHCADVFDATLYLEPWVPDAPATKGAAPPSARATPQATLTAAREPDEEAPVTRPPALVAQGPRGEEAPDADFGTELQRFAAAKATAETAVATVAAPSVATDGSAQAARQTVGAPTPTMALAHDEGDLVEREAVPGFVRQARQRAFWQSPGMRVGLSLLFMLLAVLLVAQWALHERDRLAAWQPGLKPVLEQACAPLGCTVKPLRNIEAIVIDSSALVRRLGNFHSFDLVLKNTTDVPLALPALELSLTDSRDEVISRRVFLPQEWPEAPEVLPASGSLTVSFRLSLAVGEATPMAGYRALVFYP